MLILDGRNQLQGGHVREEDVQQKKVEVLQLHPFERLGGVGRFRDLVPRPFHHFHEQLPLQGFVIHDEHVQSSPLFAGVEPDRRPEPVPG